MKRDDGTVGQSEKWAEAGREKALHRRRVKWSAFGDGRQCVMPNGSRVRVLALRLSGAEIPFVHLRIYNARTGRTHLLDLKVATARALAREILRATAVLRERK